MRPNEIFITTRTIDPEYRNDYCRESMTLMHEPILSGDDKKRGGKLEGDIRSTPFSSLLLFETRYSTHERLRNRLTIARSDFDFYIVHAVVSGGHVGDFNGRSMTAQPGDLYITDMSLPFHTRVQAGVVRAVVVPRNHLESLTNGRSLHGRVLSQGNPMARLIASYHLGLDDVLDDMSSEQASGAQAAFLSLLAAGLKDQAWTNEDLPSGLGPIFRRRVLEFIDGNIVDPRLSPDLLMRTFRVSRAHLYRHFEADGGVSKVIRERRLAFAYERLAEAGSHTRSVKQIAGLCGFSSSSQFVRLFRAHFGITPGETLRSTGHRSPICKGADGMDKLQNHFKNIAMMSCGGIS